MISSGEIISIVVLGQIGLPTALAFASPKVKINGVRANKHAVDAICCGEFQIVELGLDMVMHSPFEDGYLRATSTPEAADAFLIGAPTLFKRGPRVSRSRKMSTRAKAQSRKQPKNLAAVRLGKVLNIEPNLPSRTFTAKGQVHSTCNNATIQGADHLEFFKAPWIQDQDAGRNTWLPDCRQLRTSSGLTR
jgi:UDP-N-acetyl-D-mannosaminuronate dehydrogenase